MTEGVPGGGNSKWKVSAERKAPMREEESSQVIQDLGAASRGEWGAEAGGTRLAGQEDCMYVFYNGCNLESLI